VKKVAAQKPVQSDRDYRIRRGGVGLITALFLSLFIISVSHKVFRLHKDHLWAHLLYQTGTITAENALYLVIVVSSTLIGLGLFIFSLGWKEIRGRREELVTTGLYSIMRHPQYSGLILVVIAFLLRSPTLPMLLFSPYFIWKYVLLAKREDRELEAKCGENFRRYKKGVPGFIPSLSPGKGLGEITRRIIRVGNKGKINRKAVVLSFILASVIVSRLFIYSFRHIPLTGKTGGEELLYALVGGAALAFSFPTIPLLVIYLSVLFAAGKASCESDRGYRGTFLPASFFLLTFVAAFIIAISGVPSLVAKTIYRGKGTIDVVGGSLVGLYGVRVLIQSGLIKGFRSSGISIGSQAILLEAPILGFITGLLLFHYLDPRYDSVFFLTGRAGAFSHHPLTVGSFGAGVSVMYFALAYSLGLLMCPRQSPNVLAWEYGVVGALTATLGLSFAAGKFSSLMEVIRWTNTLGSGP